MTGSLLKFMKQNQIMKSALSLLIGIQIRELIKTIANDIVLPLLLRKTKQEIAEQSVNLLGIKVHLNQLISGVLEFATVLLVVWLFINVFRYK